jgi:hypothetical protein
MQPEKSDALVLALRGAARDLVARRSISDLEQALSQIVATAVDTVPGVDGIARRPTPSTAATNEPPLSRELTSLPGEGHRGGDLSRHATRAARPTTGA